MKDRGAGTIIASMALSIAVLGSVAFLDEWHAARAGLADYGVEQAMVARAAAGSVRAVLESSRASDANEVERHVEARLRALEQPGEVMVLLHRPGLDGLRTLDGVTIRSDVLEARFAAGHVDGAWVRVVPEKSVGFGLPFRTSIAGISEIERAPGGPWAVVLLASAHRERDREERGMWRMAVSFVLASGLVVLFGIMALRKQRIELDLAQRLAVAEAVNERDERLVRADKLATLGALATGIAHQVSTPLGVIVGRAERLAPRVADDEKAAHAVGVIAEQAQRINHIVRTFLGLARGGLPTLERVAPDDIAHAAIDLVRHRFEKAQVALECEVEDAPAKIACDPRLFEQVLVNLLLNGCDACDPGGHVTLVVRGDGESVLFEVKDDGAGMSEAALRRVHEPFFTTKPLGEGSGLGLAIAREIVAHHRGSLRLSARAEGGTVACAEVPAADLAKDLG